MSQWTRSPRETGQPRDRATRKLVSQWAGNPRKRVSQWTGAPGETSEPLNPGTPGNGQAWGPGHPRKRVSRKTSPPKETGEPVHRGTLRKQVNQWVGGPEETGKPVDQVIPGNGSAAQPGHPETGEGTHDTPLTTIHSIIFQGTTRHQNRRLLITRDHHGVIMRSYVLK